MYLTSEVKSNTPDLGNDAPPTPLRSTGRRAASAPINMANFVSIEIGGTKLQMVRGDENCRIFERRKLKVAPEVGAAGMHEQMKEALPGRLAEVAAVGVEFGDRLIGSAAGFAVRTRSRGGPSSTSRAGSAR